MQKSTTLTLNMLNNNFGFDITDMGDFWLAEGSGLKLIQIKSEIISCHFPFQVLTENEMTNLFIKEINTIEDLRYLSRLEDALILSGTKKPD